MASSRHRLIAIKVAVTAASLSRRYKVTGKLPFVAVVVAIAVSLLAGPALGAEGRVSRIPSQTADQDSPEVDPALLVERYGELRFVVDPAVRPRVGTVAPLDGDRDPRPVGAIALPNGSQSEFVLDEVIIHTTDRDELAAFVDRWNATVLDSDEADAEGEVHVVRVDVANADVDGLAEHLRSFEPEHVGEHRLSDERALKLLALVAAEQASGARATVGWLAEPTGIADGEVYEAVLGENEEPTNVFKWSYMKAGGAQDIGVAPAWQLLEAKALLDAQPWIMVVDGGFWAGGEDWPDAVFHDVIAYEPNPNTCTNGTSCPWHGTNVASAAMAEVGNHYGTAGPAGPLDANLVAVGVHDWDFFATLRRAEKAADLHQNAIVNMSFGAEIPIFKDLSEWAANRRFKRMNEDGALLLASAGNNGRNVDDDVLILPCESSRVMCVGGMHPDSTLRAPDSNYGTDDSTTSVEIYGPYCMWVNVPQDVVDWKCGTSFASPFVAGVAALIKAANHALDHEQLRDILRETAHSGGLGAAATGSQRRVNALGAVAKALGVELSAPAVTISLPGDGSEHSWTSSFEFKATAKDYNGYDLPVQWSSSLDGMLGGPAVGTHWWGSLSVGTHTITATAVDGLGQSSSDEITIEVVDTMPDIDIVTPAWSKSFTAGESVPLVAETMDPDTWSPLPDDEVKWVVQRDGSTVHEATGHSASLPYSKAVAGTYYVEVTAGGALANTLFHVQAVPEGEHAPSALITTPDKEITLISASGHPAPVSFEGIAYDKEDGPLGGTHFRWTAYDGGTKKVLCTGSDVPGGGSVGEFSAKINCGEFDTVLGINDGNGYTKWWVQLEVFDSAGLIGTDSVVVNVHHPEL